METILEDPFGEAEYRNCNVKDLNKNTEKFRKRGFQGNDVGRGVLIDMKLKQKSGEKCRIEKRPSESAMSGEGSEVTSQVDKLVVPHESRMKKIEQLHMRLQFLEEESKLMKKAILECVEERAVLMSEITQQLRTTITFRRSRKWRDYSQDSDCPSTAL